MDKHPWQNRDGPPAFVTTAPGSALADALAQALERVRLHAQRMELAMVRPTHKTRLMPRL